jgi:cytochrome c oxidase subunit 3
MPATFTPDIVEIEKKHTGGSGRPPVVRRPTGGGGDGDWSNRPPGKRGPRELLGRYRLGLFFALAGDLMFFIALVSAFFVRQSTGHFDAREQWINDWKPVLIPPILWLNTFVLLISSITMELARRPMFREQDVMEEWLGLGKPAARRAGPWLVATFLLGGVFLAGQVVAWKQLAAHGAYFATNPSSHFFYLLTATHAAHLLLGLAALTAAGIGLVAAGRVEIRQILVDTSAWYWHTMGVLWIFLFVLLVFFQ